MFSIRAYVTNGQHCFFIQREFCFYFGTGIRKFYRLKCCSLKHVHRYYYGLYIIIAIAVKYFEPPLREHYHSINLTVHGYHICFKTSSKTWHGVHDKYEICLKPFVCLTGFKPKLFDIPLVFGFQVYHTHI